MLFFTGIRVFMALKQLITHKTANNIAKNSNIYILLPTLEVQSIH